MNQLGRNDCNFDIAVAVREPFEDAAERSETLLSCNEGFGAQSARMDGFQSFTDVARRVMKTGFDCYLGIVNQRCVQGNVGTGRTAAEEVNGSAASYHAHRLLPGFGGSDRLDH